jgi:hypothetical protein
MDVPLGINEERPASVSGERAIKEPLLGCPQQDRVLVLLYKKV